MKASFIKMGKPVCWMDVSEEVLNNPSEITTDDIRYIESQSFAKELVTRDGNRIEVLPANPPRGRDLYGGEIVRIYKSKGKYYVHDTDDTKRKLGIGLSWVRVVDVPTSLKGYKTTPKSKCPFGVNVRKMF